MLKRINKESIINIENQNIVYFPIITRWVNVKAALKGHIPNFLSSAENISFFSTNLWPINEQIPKGTKNNKIPIKLSVNIE